MTPCIRRRSRRRSSTPTAASAAGGASRARVSRSVGSLAVGTCGRQDGVPEADQLGPLVAQVEEDPFDVGQGLRSPRRCRRSGSLPRFYGTYHAEHANRLPDGHDGHGDGLRGRRARPRPGGDRPDRDPPRDRRARLRHAGQHPRGGQAGPRRRLHPLPAVPRACRPSARRSPRTPRPARASRSAPTSVVVTPGAKPIMFYAMLALVEPGDEVIVPDPGFPIYESMARFAGGTPVPLPDPPGARVPGSTSTSSTALVTPRTRLLVLNSPANPTGGRLHPRRHRAHRRARPRATTSSSSPTRSTAGSSTRASTSRSPRCRGCRSGRSSSTGSPRRTR